MNTPFRTILWLASILPLAATAQGPVLGIKGGMSISNLYNNEVNDDNSRMGFNGGLLGRTMPGEPIGLQVELLYSTKGNETTYTGFFGLIDQTVDFNLNYLELPVLACFRLGEGGFELQAGGYAAWLLSAQANTSGDLGESSDELDIDHFQNLDAGLAGGLAFNSGPMQFGARYLYGLSNIAESDEAEFLLGDAKNSCAQVYLAFGITGE